MDSDGNSVHGSAAQSYSYSPEDKYYQQTSWARKAAPKSQLILLERFKKELTDRGGRGLIGLRRQFKIFDTNGNGVLDFFEFKKAIEDYDIQLHPKDVENLFKTFDSNGDGVI